MIIYSLSYISKEISNVSRMSEVAGIPINLREVETKTKKLGKLTYVICTEFYVIVTYFTR